MLLLSETRREGNLPQDVDNIFKLEKNKNSKHPIAPFSFRKTVQPHDINKYKLKVCLFFELTIEHSEIVPFSNISDCYFNNVGRTTCRTSGDSSNIFKTVKIILFSKTIRGFSLKPTDQHVSSIARITNGMTR